MNDFDWMTGRRLLVDFWEPDAWWFTVDFGRFIRSGPRWSLEGPSGTLVSSTQGTPRAALGRVRHFLNGAHIVHAGIRPGTGDLVLQLYPNMRLEFPAPHVIRGQAPNSAVGVSSGFVPA